MIRLISCGYNYIHRDGILIDRPQGAGNYAFVFFKSRSEVVVEGTPAVAEKNTFILFHPDTPHLYREVEKPFVNDWFHCEGSGMEKWLEQLHFPLNTPIPAPDPLLITRVIMDLHGTARQNSTFRDAILDLDIRSLLMKLCDDRHGKNAVSERAAKYYRELTGLRNRLYSSPQTHMKVEQLAASVHLSKSYFQHLYKELFGCTVIHDIICGRLEYAKYLLDNSQLSVSDIAAECGYDNDTHFMRQFKKYVGVTPSQYKHGVGRDETSRSLIYTNKM
jgi:AraC family transcriptional regulator of arabinose operon